MSRTGEMKSPKSVCVVYTEKNGCVSMPKRCGGEVVVCLRHGEKLRRICSALKGYAIHGDRSACSPAWHVPQRGMFLSVACSPMWYLPLPFVVELQRVVVYAAKM